MAPLGRGKGRWAMHAKMLIAIATALVTSGCSEKIEAQTPVENAPGADKTGEHVATTHDTEVPAEPIKMQSPVGLD
jgi:PBP1b-binding outer membrane lipoprotein LpoB